MGGALGADQDSEQKVSEQYQDPDWGPAGPPPCADHAQWVFRVFGEFVVDDMDQPVEPGSRDSGRGEFEGALLVFCRGCPNHPIRS